MRDRTAPPENTGSEVTVTTTQIESCLANFVAGLGGVRLPFVYTVKWLWQDGGPVAHVSVTKAPPNVLPTPSRFVGKKKGTP